MNTNTFGIAKIGPGLLCLMIAALVSGCVDPQAAPSAGSGSEPVVTPVSATGAPAASPAAAPGSNYMMGRYTAVEGTMSSDDGDDSVRIPAESEDAVIFGGHDNGSIGMWLEDEEEISKAPLRHVRGNTYSYSITDHSGHNYEGVVTFLGDNRIYNELSLKAGGVGIITKRIIFRRRSIDEMAN